MLIVMLLIALVIGLFFLIAVISLSGYVYNGMKKKADIQKKCLNILIPSGIICLAFLLVNTVLAILYLRENGERLAELLLRIFGLLREYLSSTKTWIW